MFAILKKEFKSYFLSPIGYVVIGIFLFVFSVFFYLTVISSPTVDLGALYYYTALYGLIIIAPILTMRMFAEERKTGTEQILFTSPKSVTQIVLGKFLAATIVVLISTALTIMYFAILAYFGEPHLSSALVSILGFALLSIAYVSFGMFASSLTENQIVAAVIAIGFFLISWFSPRLSSVFGHYSLMYAYYGSFMSGTISITNLVLLLSTTAMFIFFTIMVLQRRKLVK